MARITRNLAAGAVAALSIGTLGATAAPANADGSHHRNGGKGFSLTRSAAATLDKFDVDLEWGGNARHSRLAHDRNGARGSITFDGTNADVTWSRIRINERKNKVTAVVGGERIAVLKFRDSDRKARATHRGHHRTVLRLTDAGADSIDKAAGADAFDAGDAFAKKGHRHYRHHR
ncbi:hypothetical protein ABIE44_000416 [Marmoricola sp. OAE513]|uniref:hypothetical protein n=1 Tax=Marmoricola sp. OAE513 TaxID=2817894 RepID=UPI001AE1297B